MTGQQAMICRWQARTELRGAHLEAVLEIAVSNIALHGVPTQDKACSFTCLSIALDSGAVSRRLTSRCPRRRRR